MILSGMFRHEHLNPVMCQPVSDSAIPCVEMEGSICRDGWEIWSCLSLGLIWSNFHAYPNLVNFLTVQALWQSLSHGSWGHTNLLYDFIGCTLPYRYRWVAITTRSWFNRYRPNSPTSHTPKSQEKMGLVTNMYNKLFQCQKSVCDQSDLRFWNFVHCCLVTLCTRI